MSEVITRLRAKYPAYKDVPDDELTVRLGKAYPIYLTRDPQFRADYDRLTGSTQTVTQAEPAPTEDQAPATDQIINRPQTGTAAGETALPEPGAKGPQLMAPPPAPQDVAQVPSTFERNQAAMLSPEGEAMTKKLTTPSVDLPLETYVAPVLGALDPELSRTIAGKVKEQAEGMTSIEGLATVPYMALGGAEAAAIKGGVGAAARIAAGGFALQGAESLTKSVPDYLKAVKAGDREGAARAWMDMAASSAMILGGASAAHFKLPQKPPPVINPTELLPRAAARLATPEGTLVDIGQPKLLPAPGETLRPSTLVEMGEPSKSTLTEPINLPASELGPRTAGYRIELPVEPETAKAARQVWSKPVDVQAQETGAESLRKLVSMTEEKKTAGEPYQPPTVNVDLRQLEKMLQRNTVSTVEGWADKVIQERMQRASGNPFIDPEFLSAAMVKGAILFKRGVVKLAEWNDEMRKQFGRGIEDRLPLIYQQSKEYWSKVETEGQDAISKRETTPVPLEVPPGHSAEVGARVREQAATEGAQGAQAETPVGTPPTEEEIAKANRSARSRGAVGENAITPRYVAETVKPGETVLNFGAGKPAKTGEYAGKYMHSEMIREKGADVAEYDFGANKVGDLGEPRDTVFASNVLNVQSNPDMLLNTLQEIKDATKQGGRAVFNYPSKPRYAGLSPEQVAQAIKDVFGEEPRRVGGTKQQPLWEVTNSLKEAPEPSGSSGKLGIVPSGVGKGVELARHVSERLRLYREGLKTLFSGSTNRRYMNRKFEAGQNLARLEGRQAYNDLRLEAPILDRQAAYAIIEADSTYAKLGHFLTQVRGVNEMAERAVRHAMVHYTRLQPLVNRVRSMLDAQFDMERSTGTNPEYREAYIPHILDVDLLMGTKRPIILAGGGRSGISTAFKKGRTFDTIFDAIQAGYNPKTLDVAKVVEHRIRAGQEMINKKLWSDALRGVHDPTDLRPIITDLERHSRGPGQPDWTSPPMGYVTQQVLPGVPVAVHEGYAAYFKALTGESAIDANAFGKTLLNIEGGIKHGLLLFDTFHASRILQKELFLTRSLGGLAETVSDTVKGVTGGKVDPGFVSKGTGYKKGYSLLEYADASLDKAVNAGEITPEMANWVRANRAKADLLVQEGFNVGRIQEALYASVIRHWPVIGTFNKWVFEKMTRGAMMESGLIEFDRVKQANPTWTDTQAAQYVGRRLNELYGNLGKQGLFKSRTAQDLARLLFLAPQWVESMARTEIGGYRELLVDPIAKRQSIIGGTLARSVGQGLAAYFVGTQLLNMATRGHPTWENPERGHKLDAWIPDVTGKTNGFFISPLAVVAEISHDIVRYLHSEKSLMRAGTRILSNKASPFLRAAEVLKTGQTPNREAIPDDWTRLKYAGLALAPTPIPLSPIVKTEYPGQIQRQLTASLGFKTEPAPTNVRRISELAKEFAEEHGRKTPIEIMHVVGTGYGDLRAAIRREDDETARKELAKLRAAKKDEEILREFKAYTTRPFTGTVDLERKFKRTLSAEERMTYDKAINEKKDMLAKLKQLLKE